MTYYPNPFSKELIIEFNSITEDFVEIEIFDINGRKIKNVQQNCVIGINKIVWDGKDGFGNQAKTGMYFIRVQFEDFHGIYKVSYIEL